MTMTGSRQLPKAKKTKKTQIVVKYDCGYPNFLTIRGDEPNFSWKQGIPLKNLSQTEWFFESASFDCPYEFKILINDELYETGENHLLLPSEINYITPHF